MHCTRVEVGRQDACQCIEKLAQACMCKVGAHNMHSWAHTLDEHDVCIDLQGVQDGLSENRVVGMLWCMCVVQGVRNRVGSCMAEGTNLMAGHGLKHSVRLHMAQGMEAKEDDYLDQQDCTPEPSRQSN